MRAGVRISSLVPSGLAIESVSDSFDSIILAVRSEGGMAECPLCGARSPSIADKTDKSRICPGAGKQIGLCVITRRFRLRANSLFRRVFAERFGDDFSRPGRAGRHGWNALSTIWGCHSTAGRQPASPSD
jgi:hypothetical protein